MVDVLFYSPQICTVHLIRSVINEKKKKNIRNDTYGLLIALCRDTAKKGMNDRGENRNRSTARRETSTNSSLICIKV